MSSHGSHSYLKQNAIHAVDRMNSLVNLQRRLRKKYVITSQKARPKTDRKPTLQTTLCSIVGSWNGS